MKIEKKMAKLVLPVIVLAATLGLIKFFPHQFPMPNDLIQYYIDRLMKSVDLSEAYNRNLDIVLKAQANIQEEIPSDNNAQLIRINEKNFRIELKNKKLSIDTRTLSLAIQGGSITYCKDKSSGEVFVDMDSDWHNLPITSDFMGFTSKGKGSNAVFQWPVRFSSVSFLRTGFNHFQLKYRQLYCNNRLNNSQLIVDIFLEQDSGEVILQFTGIESDPDLKPVSIDFPILNIKTPAVILGSGAKYSRKDAEAQDQSTFDKWGLFSPAMAIVQGLNATMAVWSETTQFAPEYIRLIHKPNYDRFILHSEQDPRKEVSQKIVSPPWRLGTFPNWLKAAKRWREKFEARTGARPLWENQTTWVRKIHAVFYGINQHYGTNEAKYAQLARLLDPEKLLYYVWNGDRIVMFGDHTLVNKINKPTPAEIKIIKRHGWPLLLYHPYTLIYSDTGTEERLDFLSRKGWLPNNYQFNPDYNGTPQNWMNYWADVKTHYFKSFPLDIIHPGSTKFQNYLIQNFKAYCTAYRADGCYFDILGTDHISLFHGNKKIVEGQDYKWGEINTIKQVRQELPELAVMSEYQSTWILPFVFYSWEGAETHSRQNKLAQTRINHPLRAALIGSYCWSEKAMLTKAMKLWLL